MYHNEILVSFVIVGNSGFGCVAGALSYYYYKDYCLGDGRAPNRNMKNNGSPMKSELDYVSV